MGKCIVDSLTGETKKGAKAVGKRANKKGMFYRYTTELGKAICFEIMSSSRGLDSILNEKRAQGLDWPNKQMVYCWRHSIPEFREMYNDAKKAQADNHLDTMLTIADEATKDTVKPSALQIHTRQWIHERMFGAHHKDKTPETDHLSKIAELQSMVQVLVKEREKDH